MAFEQLATCSAQTWTFNSKGQSPCVVATALERVCSPGAALRLTPLRVDLGYVYLGPSSVFETHSGCLCNSVYYSLMCACSVCQGGNYMRWWPYIENCTSVDTGGFPQPLPQGYSVPHWAYGDVVANNGWTMAEAQLDAGAEQSAVPIATKQRDTGAIIGGAVGGVVALALIGAFVFVFLSRRKKQKNTTSVQSQASATGSMGQNLNSPPVSGYSPQHGGGNSDVYTPQTHNTSPTYFQQSFGQQPAYMTPVMGQGHQANTAPIHNATGNTGTQSYTGIPEPQ